MDICYCRERIERLLVGKTRLRREGESKVAVINLD